MKTIKVNQPYPSRELSDWQPRYSAGTLIETDGFPSIGGMPAVAPEQCRILPFRKENLPAPGPDWYVVKFESDGARLYMHESRFRVIDNRAS